MIPIKAAGISHLTDARYFAVFAEWIGFNFEPNKTQHLNPNTARELIGWLSGVRIVGEFGKLPITQINDIVQTLQLDTIEIDHNSNIQGLLPIVSSIIRRIDMTEIANPSQITTYLADNKALTAAFVLDFGIADHAWQNLQNNTIYQNGTLQTWCKNYKIIIALPFDEQNVIEIMNKLQPFGIELQGSHEHTIGIKTFDELNNIVELIEDWAQ